MIATAVSPPVFTEKQNSWDSWSSQLASRLPSYQLADSKGEIRMFLKVLRSPETDTCHNIRLKHGGSVKKGFLPCENFRRIWKTEASLASWALRWLHKVSLIFWLSLLSYKAGVSAKKVRIISEGQAIFKPVRFLFNEYTLHICYFSKHSACLKCYLAQVSTVECSGETGERGHWETSQCFSCDRVYGFYMCECFDDYYLSIAVDSSREASSSSSF